MKRALIASLAALAAASPALAQQGETYDAEEIVVTNLLGSLELRNSSGSQTSVTITRGSDDEAPGAQASFANGVLTIAGDDDDLGDEYECKNKRNRPGYRKDGFLMLNGRYHPAKDANAVVITAPEGVKLRIEDSIAPLDIDTVGGFDLDTNQCGRIELDTVAGDTKLDISGIQAIEIGSTQGFEADISGIADVVIGSVNGAVDVEFSGIGSIDIKDGRADPLEVSLAGIGDFSFEGLAVDPDLSVSGIGEISIGDYEGDLERHRSGIGEISVN